MKTISIIIPIYQIEEEYLRKCLNSVIIQKIHDCEIILIDDGSPDNAGDICDEYAAKDNRFKVIHQQNQGVSVARNVGIEASDSEWITFIDPDDWIEANWGEVLLNAINSVDADIIMFDYYQEFVSKSRPQFFMSQSGLLDEYYLYAVRIAPFNQLFINKRYREYEINQVWNKVYKASLIKNNKLLFDFRARKGQDNIFNAEALLLASTIYYVHNPLYHYRYLQESASNRYTPNIRYYNEISFNHYKRIINRYSLPDDFKKAVQARILTRLYSYMRLYYFHQQNKMSNSVIMEEIREMLETEPYKGALQSVDWHLLPLSQKIFVFFLKIKNIEALKLLVEFRVLLREKLKKRLKNRAFN